MSRKHFLRLMALAAGALLVAPLVARESSLVGAWHLDPDLSDQRRNGGPMLAMDLEVSMVGEDVHIKRSLPVRAQERTFEVTYVTDGKPHEVPGLLGGTVNMRAKWKKEKLSLSYTLSRGGFDTDVTETWSIDKTGNLVIQYGTRVGDRNIVRREVYTPANDAP